MDTYTINEGPYWQVQEAKAKFSNGVRAASQEPQVITVHGKEMVVIISMESYRKLSSPKEDLVIFMEQSPWAGLELELPGRHIEEMREIGL
jgi:prevent-host-death family protein